ncbi:unnamed protein product [Anisakis simplex]|uniref:Autophagy-related protein n=1 Tax=Anisakis simplex TaxID=6269 RepID=A0A0M3JYX3_ANISI|nr:unnamed protein product [Anisakis simplex]
MGFKSAVKPMDFKTGPRGVDTSEATQTNSASMSCNPSHQGEQRKSVKSYRAKQYKRVRVVLPCGVIKSIAEKLRVYDDDALPIDIYLSSFDVHPATKLPNAALFIKYPKKRGGEPLALSTTPVTNRFAQSA